MNIGRIQILMLATLLSIVTPALADIYTTIDFPGAVSTDVSGINSSGVMAGTYTDSTGAQHGFKLDGDSFTAIDYPGATLTAAFSVSPRGDVAGYFLDAGNQWHGFVLSDGLWNAAPGCVCTSATTVSFRSRQRAQSLAKE